MVATSLPLFKLLSGRMAWAGERQAVLAQNLANADTPGYRPMDVAQPDFKRLLEGAARGPSQLVLARSDPGHLGGRPPARVSLDAREQRNPYEIAPAGNAVVLEEQMAKMAETFMDHQLSSGLYRKYVGMFRTALGGGGGGG